MASNQFRLGKGLDLLIRETRGGQEGEGVQTLPLKNIIPNPNQPRRDFAEKALEELTASIKVQGLLQPILVRPLEGAYAGKYEIVAGERRWRASKRAGLTEVPVLVRNFSAQDTLTAALVENLQRENLNPLEEALGMQTLKDEFGLSQEDLAARLGKSRSAVANTLRLLALPENIQKDIAEGRLFAGHARALLSITAPSPQEYLRNLILEENLSVRDAEGMAATWKSTGNFHLEALGAFASAATASLAAAAGQPNAVRENAHLENAKNGSSVGQGTVRPTPASNRPAPQSARMVELQARIGAVVSVPVKVSGKENKGKVSFSYSSKEELNVLLEHFGLAVAPASGTTHAGKNNAANK